jgi:tRNA-specific 2-thiouridylase
LTQDQLSHALFPLGEYRKDETREIARRFGLRVSEKDESQDLCFIADGEYRNFLKRNIPSALTPGDIVDMQGNILARHAGLPFYTIGQRKGLNVAVGEPLYVLELDTQRNAVVVGRREEMGKRELVAGRVNWIAGEAPRLPVRVNAKIRYRASEAKAMITAVAPGSGGAGENVRVTFNEPLRDITPGQAVVFYDGDVCLGGGIIQHG